MPDSRSLARDFSEGFCGFLGRVSGAEMAMTVWRLLFDFSRVAKTKQRAGFACYPMSISPDSIEHIKQTLSKWFELDKHPNFGSELSVIELCG